MIQAALTISRESGIKGDDVELITAIVPPHYVKLVCEPIELAQRVNYQVDTSFTVEQFKTSRPAELVVKTRDGRTLNHKVTKLIGSPDRPMPQAEIRDKFMDNATTAMSAARARAVFDQIMNIESCPSARAFAQALRG